MKKILSLAVLFGGLSLSALAQEKQVQEPRSRNERTERKANLEKKSPEEIAKIRADRKARMQDKKQLANKSPEEIAKIRADRKGRMQGKKQWANKSPEEMAKMRTERLDKELKFTDKQREEIYSYNLERAKKQAERDVVRQKERMEMRNVMKADRADFNKLLSAEQQKIWSEKMTKNEGHRFHKGRKHFRGGKDFERSNRGKIEKISEERAVDSSNG